MTVRMGLRRRGVSVVLAGLAFVSPGVRGDETPMEAFESVMEEGRTEAKQAAREARQDARERKGRGDGGREAVREKSDTAQDVPEDVEIPARKWKRRAD